MSRILDVIGGEGHDPELLERAVAAALTGTGWSLRGGAPDLVVDLADPRWRWHGLDELGLQLRARLLGVGHPAERAPYGGDPEQWIDWRRPAGPARALAVLLHGGFYRSRWTAELMTALSVDLVARGWAVANLEYRRPDRHGWDATVADLLAGVRAAREAEPRLPLVLFGHSAGGQLALQAAEALGPGAVALAVSLTGVVDLAEAHRSALGEHAVTLALGGGPEEQPERYAAADPAGWARRTTPWLLVEADDDSTDLRSANRRLSRRDDLGTPELLEGPGNHFSVIDPTTPIWRSTMTRVESLIPSPGPIAEPSSRSGTSDP